MPLASARARFLRMRAHAPSAFRTHSPRFMGLRSRRMHPWGRLATTEPLRGEAPRSWTDSIRYSKTGGTNEKDSVRGGLAALVVLMGCDMTLEQEHGLAGADQLSRSVLAGVVVSANGSDISQREQGVRQLTFTAQKHADGSVHGAYNFTTEGTFRQIRSAVVCMRVSGDRVFLVGDVRHA